MTGKIDNEVIFASDSVPVFIEAKDGKPKAVEITAYTGGKLRLKQFRHPVVIDLKGVKHHGDSKTQPLLRDHDQSRAVGHGEATVEATELTVDGTLSVEGPERDAIIKASSNGFRWQASVGGTIIDPEKNVDTYAAGSNVFVNGRTIDGPVHVVRAFLWKETSFCAIGADQNRASAQVAASFNNKDKYMSKFEKWLEAKNIDASAQTEEVMAALEESYEAEVKASAAFDKGGDDDKKSEPVDVQKAIEAALSKHTEEITAKLERQERQTKLDEVQARYEGIEGDIKASDVLDDKYSIEAFELSLIKKQRNSGGTFNVNNGKGQSEVHALALEASLMQSASIADDDIKASLPHDKADQVMDMASGQKYRGTSLVNIIAEVCAAQGKPFVGAPSDEDLIVANTADVQANFSTVSLPLILGRLANKAMLGAYAEADAGGVATRICSSTSTNDFKKFNRYRMTESGVATLVPPGGEIKHTTLTEEEYENQVKTYGSMISLTREMQRNDDLNAFLQLPRMLGRQARHSLEQATIDLLVNATTAAGAGTTEFFHGALRGTADQPNYAEGAGTVLSIDSLEDAYELFLNQTDKDGKPIDIDPAILLCTNANIVLARKLYNDTEYRFTDASTKETINNQWKGMFRPEKSSYLGRRGSSPSTTQWYLLSNPSTDVAGMQIAYLDNQRNPVIDSGDVAFNRLGRQWRVVFDFGVALQDPRAIVKMKGAA